MPKTERRKCVFCDGAPLTLEHAFPRWLSQAVPGDGSFTNLQVLPRRPPRRTALMDITVRSVCADCNNGWMSRLEVLARTALSPMIRGEARTLSPKDQRTVAAWAVKTAVVLETTGRARDIPKAHARWLRERGEAPPGVAVAAGHYVGTMSALYAGTRLHILPGEVRQHDLPSRQDPRFGYRATICVGQLALQAYQFEMTQFVDPEFGLPPAPTFLPIWPGRSPAMRWPPFVSLDDPMLRALVERVAH